MKYTFILTLELDKPGNEEQKKDLKNTILALLNKANEDKNLLLDLETNSIERITINNHIVQL